MKKDVLKKKYPNGGKVEPIYTDNPKDKRLQAYKDSLSLYNATIETKDYLTKKGYKVYNHPTPITILPPSMKYNNNDYGLVDGLANMVFSSGKLNKENDELGKFWNQQSKIKPINAILADDVNGHKQGYVPNFKKPVQPVIYKKKEEVRVPVPKVNYLKDILQMDEEDIKVDFNSHVPIPQAPNEDEQTTKGKPSTDYLTQQVKTINGIKTYKRKDTNSPWVEQYKDGGKIDLSDASTNRQVFSLEEFKNIVPDYQYQGYLNSGIEGLYKGIDKSKFPVLIDSYSDGSTKFSPYTYENAESNSKSFMDSNNSNKVTPIRSFSLGGGVHELLTTNNGETAHWKQYEYNNPYSTVPYEEDYMNPSPYKQLPYEPIDYGQSFKNLTSIQNYAPKSEFYREDMGGSERFLNGDASNFKVGVENMKANFAQDPASMLLSGANMVGDIATGAISAFAKPGSKASAYAQGSAKAQSVVKPLEKIPILGQASKLISGIIGGALEARRQGIEDEEQKKQFKMTEYLDRNLVTAKTPSYYGQYHAKYGANPKMMEQRVIDDIYSDFDKYMKKV